MTEGKMPVRNKRLSRMIALLVTAALFLLPRGAQADPQEPGAPAAQPTGVTLFTNSRETCVPDEEPYPYRFTPAADGLYGFYAFSRDVEVRMALRLPEEDTDLAAAEGRGTVHLEYELTAGQTCVLYVSGSGERTGEVTLEAMQLLHGRCIDQPIDLPAGEVSYPRTLLHPRETHYYRYVPAMTGWYVIRSEGLKEPMLDTQGALLDENGLTLDADDDLIFPGDSNFRICAELRAGRTYYIRVNAFSNNTGAYRLDIEPPQPGRTLPEYLALRPGMLGLGIGRSARLDVRIAPENAFRNITYASEDPAVATVDQNGTVTGVGAGVTRVYAFAVGQLSASTLVRVEPPALTALAAVEPAITLYAGESGQARVRFIPENAAAQALTWQCADETIARVDGTGNITALAPGETVVEALAPGGQTARFALTVLPERPVYRALVLCEMNYDDGRERTGGITTAQGLTDMLEGQNLPGGGYRVRTQMDSRLEDLLEGISLAFAGAREKDVSLLYISCHGDREDGESYLELHDGERITESQLEAMLAPVAGTVVVIVDCCRSGGFLGKSSLPGNNNGYADGKVEFTRFSAGRFLMLSSSGADQDSYRLRFTGEESEEGTATVLARALCEGAGWDIIRASATRLRADSDGDGAVTFQEMYEYTLKRVNYYISGTHASQSVQASDPGSQLVLFAR